MIIIVFAHGKENHTPSTKLQPLRGFMDTARSRASAMSALQERKLEKAMICACGHDESLHCFGRKSKRDELRRLSCTAQDENFHFCKCELFREARSIAKQLNADEALEGDVLVMAKEKGRKIVLFEVTAKDGKELLDKENTSNAAIFYRILVAKGEAMQRVAIYEASKSKCESGAAWERLGHQTHDTLARLRKAGFVKRIETREAVEAKAAAKKPRKPRASKKATHASTTEVASAQTAAA